jgi:hypothetical protein
MADLEQRLRELGASLSTPDASSLAGKVAAEIRRSGIKPNERPRGRRAIVVALGVAALAAVFALPDARTALERVFRLGGVEVVRVRDLPPASPRAKLARGELTTLDRARRNVQFHLLVPPDSPQPASVYISQDPPGGEVTVIYGLANRPSLLLTEFVADDLGPAILKKAGPQTAVRRVKVGRDDGIGLGGGTHIFQFTDRAGTRRQSTSRLAANTLVWVHNGVTLRIEGRLDLEDAQRLAKSFISISD